jgi:succinate dehydrogenase/fumarate reductase flavoprotein subunit
MSDNADRNAEPDVTEFDVVVLGSGIAGTTASLLASRAGARVALIEKATEPGGSAALSAGMFWTAPDYDALRKRIPLGNGPLGRSVVRDFLPTLEVIRSTGVRVSHEKTTGVMTYGIGYSFDVTAYLAAARDEVERSGGVIVTGARVLELLGDHAGVSGALVRLDNGILTRFASEAVVLATGGFQGDREMLNRYIGPNSDRLLHRSNPGSVGDGLRLALHSGAGATGAMGTFYGHLLPTPLNRFTPADYLPYSQYYSGETFIANFRGERFVDETLGDELINQDLVRQPDARALLLFDERVRQEEAKKEPFPGTGFLDRLQIAIDAGGDYLTATTLDDLIDGVAAWGVDSARLREVLGAYRAAAEAGGGTVFGVPVSAHAKAPSQAPFHALAVQPSITFTFGGISIDDESHVLSADGEVVPGLFAAGADIGGLSNYGYAGGLAPAAITGRWAGIAAAARKPLLSKGR